MPSSPTTATYVQPSQHATRPPVRTEANALPSMVATAPASSACVHSTQQANSASKSSTHVILTLARTRAFARPNPSRTLHASVQPVLRDNYVRWQKSSVKQVFARMVANATLKLKVNKSTSASVYLSTKVSIVSYPH